MMPAREGEVAPDYVLTVKSSKDKNKMRLFYIALILMRTRR